MINTIIVGIYVAVVSLSPSIFGLTREDDFWWFILVVTGLGFVLSLALELYRRSQDGR